MDKKQQEQYEKDIESVIRFLKITDPENATREKAIEMLGDMQSLAHLVAHKVISEDDKNMLENKDSEPNNKGNNSSNSV